MMALRIHRLEERIVLDASGFDADLHPRHAHASPSASWGPPLAIAPIFEAPLALAQTLRCGEALSALAEDGGGSGEAPEAGDEGGGADDDGCTMPAWPAGNPSQTLATFQALERSGTPSSVTVFAITSVLSLAHTSAAQPGSSFEEERLPGRLRAGLAASRRSSSVSQMRVQGHKKTGVTSRAALPFLLKEGA